MICVGERDFLGFEAPTERWLRDPKRMGDCGCDDFGDWCSGDPYQPGECRLLWVLRRRRDCRWPDRRRVDRWRDRPRLRLCAGLCCSRLRLADTTSVERLRLAISAGSSLLLSSVVRLNERPRVGPLFGNWVTRPLSSNTFIGVRNSADPSTGPRGRNLRGQMQVKRCRPLVE
jgi:hypothetical protein